jgi:hypothetical protein
LDANVPYHAWRVPLERAELKLAEHDSFGVDHFSIRSSIADGRRIGLSASPLAQRVTISVQSY